MHAPTNDGSLHGLVTAIRRRRLSPVELTQQALDDIARLDPLLTAFLTVAVNDALTDARRIERAVSAGREPGVLAGVPISIKDLVHVRGMRTTAGSRAFGDGIVPEQDAPIVRRLRRAGAVILGKTNLHEVALGVTSVNEHFGAVRNPWDHRRVAGGSSGGSAAAVAAGLGAASVGTDTRGSIRIPAACCGITGLKPTYGLLPNDGIVPLSPTLDHAGPMTTSVADAALMLGAMTGSRSATERFVRATRGATKRLVVGVSTWHLREMDDEVTRVVLRAIDDLRRLVREVRDVTIAALDGVQEASGVITGSEAFEFHEARLRQHPEAYGPFVRSRLEAGGTRSAIEYVRALRKRDEVAAAFATTFETVDVLVGATLPALPPLIDSPVARINGHDVNVVEAFTRFNAPQNMAGIPSLSVPCGLARGEGLPVGLQLFAARGREDLLFALGAAFQRSTDWHRRRPRVPR